MRVLFKAVQAPHAFALAKALMEWCWPPLPNRVCRLSAIACKVDM